LSLPSEEEFSEIENSVYRKSLDLLTDHTRRVQDSVRVLANAFDTYLARDTAELKSDCEKISVLENEADKIKREILDQLTKAAPGLLYREDLLRLVFKVDEVAESAVSISRLMLRLANAGWIPERGVAEGLRSMSTEMLVTFEFLRDAIMALVMNPTRVVELVARVHEGESKVDNIYHDLDFKALTEVKQVERLLIYRDLLALLENSTDKIKDASDNLRVLALHRVA
jgi:predicted phosphate transport protein (TIGR00153 family)